MQRHYNSPGRCRLDSHDTKISTLGQYIETMGFEYLNKKKHNGKVRVLEGAERDEILAKYNKRKEEVSS